MSNSEEEGMAGASVATSRRGFIGAMGGAAGVLYAGAGGMLGALPGAASAATAPRSYGAGRELLYFDGKLAGVITGREGGMPFVETRIMATPGEALAKSVVGTVKFEPLVLQFGSSMSGSLYQWMQEAVQTKTMSNRKSGDVVFTSIDGTEFGRLTFTDALISEVSLPALDAAGLKEAAAFTVKLAPETTQLKLAPSGSVKHSLPLAKAKMWLSSNFTVTIDGIDTSTVLAVDPHTTAVKIASSGVGEQRFETKEAAGVEVGTLALIVREDGARQYLDWFNQMWGPQGDPGPQFLRTVTLAYVIRDPLTGAVTSTLGRAIFQQVGISKVAQVPLETTGHSPMRKVKVELYASAVTFELKGFA